VNRWVVVSYTHLSFLGGHASQLTVLLVQMLVCHCTLLHGMSCKCTAPSLMYKSMVFVIYLVTGGWKREGIGSIIYSVLFHQNGSTDKKIEAQITNKNIKIIN